MPDREREDRLPNREPPTGGAAANQIPAGRAETSAPVGAPGVQRVSWGSVAERVRAPGIPKARSFLEWSGVWQMTLLLAFICLLAGGCLLGWTASRPDLADAVALVEAAKATGDAAAVSSQQLAQLLADLETGHTEQVGRPVPARRHDRPGAALHPPRRLRLRPRPAGTAAALRRRGRLRVAPHPSWSHAGPAGGGIGMGAGGAGGASGGAGEGPPPAPKKSNRGESWASHSRVNAR